MEDKYLIEKRIKYIKKILIYLSLIITTLNVILVLMFL